MAHNLRFWAHINGDWVKLTLTEARPRTTHHSGGPTDEGYHYETETWERQYSGQGLMVVRETCTDSRDCDGRMTSTALSYCLLPHLKAVPVYRYDNKSWGTEPEVFDGAPMERPLWSEYRPTRQRDYAAEAMGY